jgi:hypothetical protein
MGNLLSCKYVSSVSYTLKNEDDCKYENAPTTDFIKDNRRKLAVYDNLVLASSSIKFGASKRVKELEERIRDEIDLSSSIDDNFFISEDEENKEDIRIAYTTTAVGSYSVISSSTSRVTSRIAGFDYSNLVKKKSFSYLERYRVLEFIGKGAYGVVKKIQDKVSNKLYALKIVSKNSWFTDKAETNEIEVLKRLDHPNILRLYEFAQNEKKFYLITEYCEGGQLLKYIDKAKHITEELAARLMKQILSAVAYCHARQIVHR